MKHADLLRELAPQVLAVVARRFRDFAGAEDAVQEALVAAALQWPSEGLPDSPRAWLIQVASRRLTDRLRAEVASHKREAQMASPAEAWVAPITSAEDGPEPDDTLLLLFLCCHPALTRPSAIALTLRAVGGLTTAEIAKAFLVPEATMAQRISRAKQAIKKSGLGFEMPRDADRDARLGSVRHVLYLVFNEGYTASSGPELQRVDLAQEALRLAHELRRQVPRDAETAGLLALMLFTDARRRARTGSSGELIPLDEQDRSQWDRAMIGEGVALLTETLPRGAIGSYQIQAAIAAVHDQAERPQDTDWPEILGLYGLLLRLTDNPMVALNHAIAVAMVQGPVAGLLRLDAVEARLPNNHRVDAVRAHLLEMSGDRQGAAALYLRAAARTASLPERNYLTLKAARLDVEKAGSAPTQS